MKSHKTLIAIIILFICQICLLSRFVWKYELADAEAPVFKFKTSPVDPYDIYRGKYVSLNFSDVTLDYKEGNDLLDTEIAERLKTAQNEVYDKPIRFYSSDSKYKIKIYFHVDKNGFATPSFTPDKDNPDSYLDLYASSYHKKTNKLSIAYPFNKFFTNEHDAKEIEDGYNEYVKNNQDANTYVLVAIKDGVYVVKDLYINNLPSKEFLKKIREEKSEGSKKIEIN